MNILKELKLKYLDFLKIYYNKFLIINNNIYFYNLLWLLQGVLLICFIFKLIIGYKLFLIIFITLCNIHLWYTFYEIMNDYIFNFFFKKFFSIIILLISCKIIF
jgi:hypothetical protein